MQLSHHIRYAAALAAVGALVAAGTACGRSSGETAKPAAADAGVAPDPIPPPSNGDKLQPTDLYHLRSVGEVRVSPDASRIAYAVVNNNRPGRPYSQIWIMDLRSRQSARLGSPAGTASSPHWSPDGRAIAYVGSDGERYGLQVANADGTQPRLIAPIATTNHPLPSSGDAIAWSPDGKRLAFISATPGPEQDANGDPMIITRYLYKPTASEGSTRFNDNRRLHLFLADVGSGTVKQLTAGNYYEHSLDWSPAGDRILFVSNREPDPDRFFNYDVFTVTVADGSVAQLTQTKNAEYRPTWSPDGRRIAYLGTTRPITSSETTMEDTHVWVMNADGGGRHEVRESIDNRQGPPRWSGDGRSLYFTVQERGETHLYRIPAAGGKPERALSDEGSVGAWSIANQSGGASIAYALSTRMRPSDLYLRSSDGPGSNLTDLNRDLLASRKIGAVESFTFPSFDGLPIAAFLTKPADLENAPGAKHPLIVMMHGGPHGQQGPEFNSKAQVYAARGWAALMVNYRGSTGYGQKLADAIFGDQNGGEAKDVLAGVDAALKRYPWLDGSRMGLEGGSYGGQLTNWIITQTDRFRAAVPAASISNLVTQNYLSYYHDYLAVEFGGFPHQQGIIDKLWERSAIRYANRVKTPTMFVHGENDNDVPIPEAEQFYIALKDVGVETIMVRYPREGHGLREVKHVIDMIDRSIDWYERHFGGSGGRTTN
jgi:dipeptidyl aminopeptidase/acylaminoacyl peptidase